MHSRDIRKKFLNYFEGKGHKQLPSSSTVPHDDPTLLFTNAGMNQFKPLFLGKSRAEFPRATTAQKCIRVGGKHNDLDNVGHTSRHLTFFEMMGNFSFGDYFKKEAITYAWDLSTNILGIDPDKIWVTIYEDDDEAFELWKPWLPEKRIVRLKENFWMMGDTGPCGPCTELFYDRGEAFGKASTLPEDLDGERFFEFWNLVFMQYNRDDEGVQTALPKPCVDTGMGLERLASLKEGVATLFETDILRTIISKIENLSGKEYKTMPATFNVIADHLRCLSFAIADGAEPSNVDRGYVLRKVLRRAVRYGRQLGFEKPFLAEIYPTLEGLMGADYPELKAAKTRICDLVTLEEENFLRTLKKGGNMLQNILDDAKASKHKQITGEEAFKLKDTYGLPIDEIILIAKDSAVEVNLEAFALLEQKAKERSRSARGKISQSFEENLFIDFVAKHGKTEFDYEELTTEGTITGILVDGQFQERLEEGQEGALILSHTSFYAEMGGQVGDKGELVHHKAHFEVEGCTAPYSGVHLHKGRLKSGTLLLGEPVKTVVNVPRRHRIMQYHTATHLLNWALAKVLGDQIRQRGSLVEPDRLRFDFSYAKALTDGEIRQVEELINDKIRANRPVRCYEMEYSVAQKRSDINQLFGETYGATVRVVDIDDFSKELCGGTHVPSLNEIGLFRITKESSSASGVRRIEAAVGKEAEEYMYTQEALLSDLASKLGVPLSKVKEKLQQLQDENQKLKEESKKIRKLHLKQLTHDLLFKKESIGEVALIIAEVDLVKEELGPLANDLLVLLGSGILLLSSNGQLLLKISKDLLPRGLNAKMLISEIAPIIGGAGGGNAESAQAGGKFPERTYEAFAKARELLKAQCQ